MRIALLMLTLCLMCTCDLSARVDVRPPCYKALEKNFFDPTITANAFSLYDVRQGSWRAMVDELQKRSKEDVPNLTWKAGQKMQRNPLDSFYDASAAGEILGRVLFNVFHDVCVQYDVTSEGNIRDMFRYIEQQQASKLRACFDRSTFKPQEDKESKK